MSNLNEFLKEFYTLCVKHDVEITANSDAELQLDKISTGENLASDLNFWFHIKQVGYTDIKDNEIDLIMED